MHTKPGAPVRERQQEKKVEPEYQPPSQQKKQKTYAGRGEGRSSDQDTSTRKMKDWKIPSKSFKRPDEKESDPKPADE